MKEKWESLTRKRFFLLRPATALAAEVSAGDFAGVSVKVLFLASSLQEEKEPRQFSALFLEFNKPCSWQGFEACSWQEGSRRMALQTPLGRSAMCFKVYLPHS